MVQIALIRYVLLDKIFHTPQITTYELFLFLQRLSPEIQDLIGYTQNENTFYQHIFWLTQNHLIQKKAPKSLSITELGKKKYELIAGLFSLPKEKVKITNNNSNAPHIIDTVTPQPLLNHQLNLPNKDSEEEDYISKILGNYTDATKNRWESIITGYYQKFNNPKFSIKSTNIDSLEIELLMKAYQTLDVSSKKKAVAHEIAESIIDYFIEKEDEQEELS